MSSRIIALTHWVDDSSKKIADFLHLPIKIDNGELCGIGFYDIGFQHDLCVQCLSDTSMYPYYWYPCNKANLRIQYFDIIRALGLVEIWTFNENLWDCCCDADEHISLEYALKKIESSIKHPIPEYTKEEFNRENKYHSIYHDSFIDLFEEVDRIESTFGVHVLGLMHQQTESGRLIRCLKNNEVHCLNIDTGEIILGDFTRVVIKGDITKDNLQKYNELVTRKYVGYIDISECTFDISDDDLYDLSDEPLFIKKLIDNRLFAQKFIVENYMILSADRRVLVHYNSEYTFSIPKTVEIIGHSACASCMIDEVVIPEGVTQIGSNVFEYITHLHLPATLRVLEPDFYDHDYQADPYSVPYVEVNPNNPIFYSKDGTLYKYGESDAPYLRYPYIEYYEQEEPLIIYPTIDEQNLPILSVEELKTTVAYCKPINDEKTLFYTYHYQDGCNIIDRQLHHYINSKKIMNLYFSKNNFILIKTKDFSSIVYSIDLKNILLEEYDDYHFEQCDDAGRIYVSKDVPIPEGRSNSLMSVIRNNKTLRMGCIDVNKEVIIPCEYNGYESIQQFNEDGFAIAQKGSKFGVIDINNNICVPFEYTSFYSSFDKNKIAIVFKTSKKISQAMFINYQNEILGTFLEKDAPLWENRFHIYSYKNLYGFAKQFGQQYTQPTYQDIRIIDKLTIQVSVDGYHYEVIKY